MDACPGLRGLGWMVRVDEDAGLKRLFLERLQEHYGQSKEGFFITDFVYCMRKAHWRAGVLEKILGSPPAVSLSLPQSGEVPRP